MRRSTFARRQAQARSEDRAGTCTGPAQRRSGPHPAKPRRLLREALGKQRSLLGENHPAR